MRAMRFHQFGDPNTIHEDLIDDPQPGPGEVLVEVAASSINPADWQIGAGLAQDVLDVTLPFTPGIDVAGTVTTLGAGVDPHLRGRRVFGAELLQRSGAFAQRMAIPAARITEAPASIPLRDAAAVPLAALTAWEAVYRADQANVQPGQEVLIHGGAGGTGLFAVQFAVLRGAHVTVTASAANHDHLRSLGAHQTIDYNRTQFEDHLGDLDAVIDLVGGNLVERSLPVLRRGGTLTTLVPAPPQLTEQRRQTARGRELRLTTTSLLERRDLDTLHAIRTLIDTGRLRVVISEYVPLDDLGRALAASQAGHARGKTVVDVSA